VIKCDGAVRSVLNCYLELIRARAKGEVLTTAQWMRQFITAHPEYRQDSKISETIMADLMERCVGIGNGEVDEHELLGPLLQRMSTTMQRVREEGAGGESPRDGASPRGEGKTRGASLASSVGSALGSSADGRRETMPIPGSPAKHGAVWDAAASQRWTSILTRITAEEDDEAEMLRGASLPKEFDMGAMGGAVGSLDL